MNEQFRRLDASKLGPDMDAYVATCRRAGLTVSVYEHIATGALDIVTHHGDEPSQAIMDALAARRLLDMGTGRAQ